MKDFLLDLVNHTHNLGFLPFIKITASSTETLIESMAEDKSVIMTATTHKPVTELDGVFGMPNLNKLDLHLKCGEYRDSAQLSLITREKNGTEIPVGIHFKNASGDFQNDYRFMNHEVVNEKLRSVKFKGAKWNIELKPSAASILRFKYQAAAHTEETVFQITTSDNNLVFSFGDASTHAGKFVFQSDITGTLKHTLAWPINRIQSLLNLDGDITMYISDAGALQITVDSGITTYNYILPAHSK